ncbi:hypothetical protein BofuT4_uP068490.1 [Botrytis cinerea T4]|uniref:Uncharacterized protein n=1 Tax=Botryotinia fuckeliana (strain T4) TaxID=999810 RepID=G2XQU6_BOTF4|nr:hypothetical protein BofuT4_uP068490.1 [Botrytis cinerea T4]
MSRANARLQHLVVQKTLPLRPKNLHDPALPILHLLRPAQMPPSQMHLDPIRAVQILQRPQMPHRQLSAGAQQHESFLRTT